MVKEENTLINIAICDDLVFASKIEAMLLQISKKADDKNEYRSFCLSSLILLIHLLNFRILYKHQAPLEYNLLYSITETVLSE